ncbi:MAG TPA: tryptophan--tRNA ligase [Alphaproteobacteria bacterium]|jgi:tryptophanyl-tRNA synthetase|nr:tryptophan--tRNA ligase [Alphaproteobacteria bacterium]
MQKRVFSGIQPSGNLHIGNYIGAIKHWVAGQNDGLNIFCIVDMHAITTPQDPKILNEKTLEIAAILLAAGIDPEKSILFVQSQNPDHANLGWIMNCMASMGQMNRMTQFKDKSENKEFVSVGLFDYPALMAADILLYDTTHVPVGEDQKQHVELARDLAERFNSKFGETFTLPMPVIPKVGGRVMSLVDPTKKMSKSDPNKNATIYLLDSEEEVIKKIKSAATDSGSEIKKDVNKHGISNLIDIYSEFSGLTVEEIETKFAGKNYGEFKQAVAESVNNFLKNFQEKYNNLRQSSDLKNILKQGSEKAKEISGKKLEEVYEKVGFVKI